MHFVAVGQSGDFRLAADRTTRSVSVESDANVGRRSFRSGDEQRTIASMLETGMGRRRRRGFIVVRRVIIRRVYGRSMNVEEIRC